jgi:hypothetical protein
MMRYCVTCWNSTRTAVLDVMGIKMCGEMDLLGCILLAGFVAIAVHPLIYGNVGTSIVALMTPVR